MSKLGDVIIKKSYDNIFEEVTRLNLPPGISSQYFKALTALDDDLESFDVEVKDFILFLRNVIWHTKSTVLQLAEEKNKLECAFLRFQQSLRLKAGKDPILTQLRTIFNKLSDIVKTFNGKMQNLSYAKDQEKLTLINNGIPNTEKDVDLPEWMGYANQNLTIIVEGIKDIVSLFEKLLAQLTSQSFVK
ncbi:uncharacterized protein LOC119662754 [Teleopsis dalmanni]|uniref:uncharacterized protein LOC119662754 n=1 Tax=Teleopsis dalmanni TaxID=139649 RepID=UPI0018CE3E90|nr:uncharacterized protein LOC119662754 [Teleopsis dalmanni]